MSSPNVVTSDMASIFSAIKVIAEETGPHSKSNIHAGMIALNAIKDLCLIGGKLYDILHSNQSAAESDKSREGNQNG